MDARAAHEAEWTAVALRPVARWVRTTDADGRTRLVRQWSVPEPTVAQAAAGLPA